MNPFRCMVNGTSGSPHLFHAILALSIHHLWRNTGNLALTGEVAAHKGTAVQLYEKAIQAPRVYSVGWTIFDTALILFAFNVGRPTFQSRLRY
jgi:hypothetical protein